MNTQHINLQRFCAGRKEPRAFLQQPFQLGGKACAMDGFLFVAVETLPPEGLVMPPAEREVLLSGLLTLAAQAAQNTEGWVDAASYAVHLLPCRHCEGTGEVTEITCEDCEGEGEFDYGNCTYECKNCDGYGTEVAEEGGTPTSCGACEGSGDVNGHHPAELKLPNRNHVMQVGHVNRIAKLPDAQINTQPVELDLYPFRFTGGYGVVKAATLQWR